MNQVTHTNIEERLHKMGKDSMNQEDVKHRYELRRALLNSRYFDKPIKSISFVRILQKTSPFLLIIFMVSVFSVSQFDISASSKSKEELAKNRYLASESSFAPLMSPQIGYSQRMYVYVEDSQMYLFNQDNNNASTHSISASIQDIPSSSMFTSFLDSISPSNAFFASVQTQ